MSEEPELARSGRMALRHASRYLEASVSTQQHRAMGGVLRCEGGLDLDAEVVDQLRAAELVGELVGKMLS